MKSVSAGVRVAILFLLLGDRRATSCGRTSARIPRAQNNYTLFAKFRDASGLPKGSKVVIAGLPKGEVTGLEVEGRYAKVTFKSRTTIKVWSSGVVIKKATSLLGDNYLEIDPGEQIEQVPDGTQADVHAARPEVRRLPRLDRAKSRRVPAGAERRSRRRRRIS